MLGAELKKVRLEKRLSQTEVATAANIGVTHVSNLEREKQSPTVDVLFRLCRALGIAPHEVIKRVEQAMEKAGETDLRSVREKVAARRLATTRARRRRK